MTKREINAQELLDNINFKEDKDDDEIATIHGLLLIVLLDMAYWHHDRNYEMTITDLVSTLEEDIELGRESDSHRTKRAADLRCKHLSDLDRRQFIHHFNTKYADIASVSRSDLVPRIVVEHGEGENRHFHVALNFKYRITE